MRFVPIILGLCVAFGGYYALSVLDPERSPGRTAYLAETPEAAIALYREALRRDPGSPYRWADLADALALNGGEAEARRLYEEATRLAPGIPQIAVRAANFHFLHERPQEGLREAARALRLVDAFDLILFRSLDRMAGDTAAVLKEIGGDQRSTVAYAHHLIATRQVEGAVAAWQWCRDRGYAGDRLAASYLDLLLGQKRYAAASQAWVSYLGARRGDYPLPNLVFNGSFEREPSGAALDWRILPSDKFETSQDRTVARDGNASLRIRFQGTENVTYGNLVQSVVAGPGRYRFQAWVKTDSITTNEGPRFQLYDPASPARLDVRIGPFTGSSDWIRLNEEIAVGPDTHLIVIRVLRQQSFKFDHKINGTIWIDGISLVRS